MLLHIIGNPAPEEVYTPGNGNANQPQIEGSMASGDSDTRTTSQGWFWPAIWRICFGMFFGILLALGQICNVHRAWRLGISLSVASPKDELSFELVVGNGLGYIGKYDTVKGKLNDQFHADEPKSAASNAVTRDRYR